jgi:3-hydroxyacyl-CoA dehydrogenase
VTIDNAMKWGWNWELGPFETWDALGVRETAERLEKEGREVPALVRDLLASGKSSFYATRNTQYVYFDIPKRDYSSLIPHPSFLNLRTLRESNKVILRNPGASLIDLGDGVACLEFHSKMNALGPDQLSMIHQAQEEVRKNFVGLVIGNQAEHFSVGANLVLILTQIQNQDWDDIDLGIRQFQRATSSLRQFEKPVVIAVHGYTLGGGCEVAMGGDYVIAAAESYVGLPEVGVGVIPGAGGCKEMLIRCTENAPRSDETDYFPYVRKAWETIGLAKVSTSAHEAIRNGHLRERETTIVLNRDWLIGEAKAKVLQLAAQGYRPQPPRNDIPAIGEAGIAQFKLILHLMRRAEQISDYDVKIGTRLAHVLCGGDLTSLHFVSEQYILDLEREAFLSLCGEPKTMERIQHMLKTGRALRN